MEPRHADALNMMGVIAGQTGRHEAAEDLFRQAIALNPMVANYHGNLGSALRDQGHADDAVAAYRVALRIKPDSVVTLNNLGIALSLGNRIDDAIAAYRAALDLDPGCADARFNQAMLLLLRGDFKRAWPMYEARWDLQPCPLPKRNFPQELWDGRPLHGQRVLIHAEQGLGDSIQFIRYAPKIVGRGGVVVVESQRSLAELFRGAGGVDTVVAAGEPLPAFDFHVPMLSLPLVFRTAPETIPRETPYLFADPARCESWRARLGGDRSRLRVGIAWAGNPKHRLDGFRSVSLRQLLPLLDVDGVDFFSLQKDCGAEQIRQLPGASGIVDHTNSIRDFADTAALLAQLDLVISVDTAVLHLAGALGTPAWALLAFAPDWRWFLDRSDSPWYPAIRLFRQSRLAEWEPVVAAVREELHNLVQSRRGEM